MLLQEPKKKHGHLNRVSLFVSPQWLIVDLYFYQICMQYYAYIGWWFGTFGLFFRIFPNHPNWLIFFRGVGIPPTSNVYFYLYQMFMYIANLRYAGMCSTTLLWGESVDPWAEVSPWLRQHPKMRHSYGLGLTHPQIVAVIFWVNHHCRCF